MKQPCTIKVFTEEDLELMRTLFKIDKALFPYLEKSPTFCKWEQEFNEPIKEND